MQISNDNRMLHYLHSSVSRATVMSLSSIQPWWSSLSLPETRQEKDCLSIAYTTYMLYKTCVFCPIFSIISDILLQIGLRAYVISYTLSCELLQLKFLNWTFNRKKKIVFSGNGQFEILGYLDFHQMFQTRRKKTYKINF